MRAGKLPSEVIGLIEIDDDAGNLFLDGSVNRFQRPVEQTTWLIADLDRLQRDLDQELIRFRGGMGLRLEA